MAYFLSQRRAEVTVVERTEVAAAASGKAGGFLARDWCAGTPLDALARRSFELHATLAHEIGNDWGHRGMTAYSGPIATDFDSRRRKPSQLNWLAEGVVVASRIGTPPTTANDRARRSDRRQRFRGRCRGDRHGAMVVAGVGVDESARCLWTT
jgi:glycine/D-amino acid oxidase-like deaminating enzyme